MTDQVLLKQFVQLRSQQAFEAIVRRYIDTVYNAALRQVRDSSLAEDVCQAVFMILANKASSLSPKVVLPGWLIRTTHLCACDLLKAESRRKAREQRYAAMSLTHAFYPDFSSDELSPQIDRALSRLSEADRGVIVLRYLQDEPLARVASMLNLSEEAAAKRIQRALKHLRDYFVRHPITPSVMALSASMHNLPKWSTPTSLAHSIATALPAPSPALSTSILKFIFWSKARLITASLALAGMTTIGIVSIVGAQMASSIPLSAATTKPSTQPAAAVARLSCGVWAQILGVSAIPTDDKSWWTADGTPLPNAPFKEYFKNSDPHLHQPIDRQIAVSIHWPKGDPATIPSGSWSFGTTTMDLPNVDDPGGATVAHNAVWGTNAASSEPLKLRISVAAGPWQNYLRCGVEGQTVSRDGETYSISQVTETNGHVQFRLSRTHHNHQNSYPKLTVIDKAGVDHHIDLLPADAGVEGATVVAPVALGDLKEITFDVRRDIQWIEISNICLDRAHPTVVKIVTSENEQGL